MEIIGKDINDYIEKHEISPALFARFINEPVASVLAWKRGEPIPPHVAEKIAKKIVIGTMEATQ
tara:strand:- start:5381 stop:5572 length:192 start_codon:yes stop_codon:yes gene_type:complete